MGNKVSLEENLIDLKIVSKQMLRSAQKCEQNEKAAINKLKKVSLTNVLYISRRRDLERYSFLAAILDFKHIKWLGRSIPQRVQSAYNRHRDFSNSKPSMFLNSIIT